MILPMLDLIVDFHFLEKRPLRPSALSTNAYDDYAYSLKGAITYGIFSNTGSRRRISRIPGRTWRTWHTGRTRRTWRTRGTRVSGNPRTISGGAPGGVQAPTAPPPQFVPQMTSTTFAIDPGGIRRCLFRNTYIWLNNGEQFWFFPVFVGRNSIAGFRWNGFFWSYFGIDLNRISSFTCF